MKLGDERGFAGIHGVFELFVLHTVDADQQGLVPMKVDRVAQQHVFQEQRCQ
jgi:hypothetical protein